MKCEITLEDRTFDTIEGKHVVFKQLVLILPNGRKIDFKPCVFAEKKELIGILKDGEED